MSPDSEHETTVTSTLYLGARVWKGAELYVNPELSGGSGLSRALGVAGFPNGESFRVGDSQPRVYLARLMLRQTIAVGPETEAVPDEANQLGGRRPIRRWTLTVGKFGIGDFFDDNAYSHDPRTQFLNWADWTAGAWDYSADTRGYTWGLHLGVTPGGSSSNTTTPSGRPVSARPPSPGSRTASNSTSGRFTPTS